MFGHSHNGKPCTGHHGGGGHSHGGLENLTKEQKAHLMKMFQERMKMMQEQGFGQGGHGHSHGGDAHGDHGGEGHGHGGDGHSHGGDGEGHSHGGGRGHGGRPPPVQGGLIFEYPGAHELREASGFINGYGHELPPPIKGWGELAPPMPEGRSLASPSSINRNAHLHAPPPRDNYWRLSTPWGRRLRIVKDRNGMLQALVVILYWLYGNWSTWNVILLPYYKDGQISLFTVCVYTAVSILCIISFLQASTSNPGSLRKSDVPQDEWTECHTCQHLRPPLSHHCRRCGHCVLEMDHHCPWINNCVGEENKYAFMQLVAYAFLLSAVTLLLEIKYFLLVDECKSCDVDSLIYQYQVPITWGCVACAVTMLFGASNLFITQHISLIHNLPTVEWMRLQQEMMFLGKSAESVFPARVQSIYQAYNKMCGGRFILFWIFPCRWRRVTSAGRHLMSA